ncbi:hypothetical protein QM996_17965 [Sinorhizobium chiapasense]
MSIERATKKSAKATRSVTLPGKRAAYLSTDPVDIARELRAKSRLGQREAKLAAAEAKLRG